MSPIDIVGLVVGLATKAAGIAMNYAADKKKSVEEARAEAHAAVEEFLDGLAGLRARVEADDAAALDEALRKAAARG